MLVSISTNYSNFFCSTSSSDDDDDDDDDLDEEGIQRRRDLMRQRALARAQVGANWISTPIICMRGQMSLILFPDRSWPRRDFGQRRGEARQ